MNGDRWTVSEQKFLRMLWTCCSRLQRWEDLFYMESVCTYLVISFCFDVQRLDRWSCGTRGFSAHFAAPETQIKVIVLKSSLYVTLKFEASRCNSALQQFAKLSDMKSSCCFYLVSIWLDSMDVLLVSHQDVHRDFQ